ncbi:MAG: SBBP repeat-containing protein, partial [Bacteroidota bacterium]
MKILNVKAIAIILLFVMQSIYAQTPSWQWAFGVGSTGAEMATANATDAAGNLYTVGWYTSANITFGSITLTNPGLGTSDIFITKHSATGTALWAKTFGGSDGEIASSISLDSNGDIYVTGWF